MTSSQAAFLPMLKVANANSARTTSRAELVYSSLRDAISEGRIGCGARIREEEIANMLGVSRTPVREALQRLEQRGLLTGGRGGMSSRN